MRKAVLFSFLLFTFIFGQGSKSTPPVNQSVLMNYYHSISEFDFAQMRIICADDFRLVESSGVYSLDEYIGFLEPDVDQVKMTFKFDDLRSIEETSASWFTYIKTTKMKTENKEIVLKSRETAILTKINDEWKIRLIHSSSVKD